MRGRLPSGFLELDGARLGFRHRAPEPGEHNHLLELSPGSGRCAARRRAPRLPRRPLDGLRVVDFGIIVIGNEIGRALADQGADVIKVENRAFPDAARVGYGGGLSHSFVAGSRNKRSFGVDLRTPEGVALLKRLVAEADVVLENFKPGTLERLGLGYETLRAVNPGVVMLSTNALGSSGPWSGWLGYGPIVRCVSGIAGLWRYPDDELAFGEPTTLYPDHYGARVCATAVLAALIRRRRTARGAHRSRPGRADPQPARRRLPGDVARRGDPDEPWAVHPCAGDDEWCVIALRDDAQWQALRRVAGDRPDRSPPPPPRPAAARPDPWTRTRSPREVMERLQAAGVPAAMMMRPDDHEADPHLRPRGIGTALDQPGLGTVRVEQGPFRSRAVPPVRIAPAPQHGEHTREICATLLGLPAPEIDALFAAGVLEEPLPVRRCAAA